MQPGRIKGATRILYAPDNWDSEQQGPCCKLAVRDSADGRMVSAWYPSVEEMARMVKGAPVYLHVVSEAGHPPVAIEVGEATSS